jgi:hypothetical protein
VLGAGTPKAAFANALPSHTRVTLFHRYAHDCQTARNTHHPQLTLAASFPSRFLTLLFESKSNMASFKRMQTTGIPSFFLPISKHGVRIHQQLNLM